MIKETTLAKPAFYKSGVLILVLTHLVGILGFTTGWSDLFLRITPFHLVIVFAIILVFQEKKDTAFWVFAVFVGVVSFLVELIGVQTGFPFGSYSYGHVLGLKIAGTPAIISILWASLILSVGYLLKNTGMSNPVKSLVGAGLMLGIDIFIEPVATKLGFWTWENDAIPIQNYVGWFFTSWVLLLVFNRIHLSNNRIAALVYPIQLLFFFIIGSVMQ